MEDNRRCKNLRRKRGVGLVECGGRIVSQVTRDTAGNETLDEFCEECGYQPSLQPFTIHEGPLSTKRVFH